jgi:hypothetical protein
MEIAAGLLLALALGGMAFFSFVFSPLVFVKLPGETAGPFIRQVFPWYFLAVAIVFALAALALAPAYPGLALLAGAMALLGALNRQVLMPRINRSRDRMLAGDVAARRPFDRLHRASVGINLVQLLAAGLALGIVLAP